MSIEPRETNVDRIAKTGQILVFAMLAGIVAFGGVVMAIGPTGGEEPPDATVLLIALAAVAVTEIPAFVVIRMGIVGNLKKRHGSRAAGDPIPDEIVNAHMVLTLIGGAMAEGVGLFGLVIVLLTGNWLAMIAPALAIVILAAFIPSRAKIERFAAGLAETPMR